VFSFWPDELKGTGERIDPAKLEMLLTVFKAYDEAAMMTYRLANLRDTMVAEYRVPVEEAR
jgi:hypothetical protein